MRTPVVLLIEDHREFRDLLRKQLLESGCQVMEADDLVEGFRCFLKQLPDLIVSKITTGSSATLQTIADMKTVHPVCRIVAISDDWMKLVSTRRANAFDAQFCKPLSLGALLDTIRKFLQEGFERN